MVLLSYLNEGNYKDRTKVYNYWFIWNFKSYPGDYYSFGSEAKYTGSNWLLYK